MNAHTFCPEYNLAHAFWGYLHWEPFTIFSRTATLQFLPSDCYIIHFLLAGRLELDKNIHSAGDAWIQSPAKSLQIGVYSQDSEIFSVYLRSSCYHPELLQGQRLQEKLGICCENLREINSHNTSHFGSQFSDGYCEVLSDLHEMISASQSLPKWLAKVTQPLSIENWEEENRKDLPLCERHFRRKFKQIMGLAPSLFFRLQRFHHVLRLRKEKPYLDLIDLISLCKFYDHSHFTREFKHFSGLCPTKFFEQHEDYKEFMIPSLMFSDVRATG